MGLSLERLLWLAVVPLLAAASIQKKNKRAKKPSRPKPARSTKPKRAQKPPRRHARPLPKKAAKQVKRDAAHGRPVIPARPPFKPAPKAAALPVEPVPTVAPVGRPILLLPEQGKYADSVNPKFRWLSVGGATRYQVEWGQDPSMANSHTAISMATEAAVPVEKPLTVAEMYYWRARGGNEAGWGPWSMVGSFSVLEEPE